MHSPMLSSHAPNKRSSLSDMPSAALEPDWLDLGEPAVLKRQKSSSSSLEAMPAEAIPSSTEAMLVTPDNVAEAITLSAVMGSADEHGDSNISLLEVSITPKEGYKLNFKGDEHHVVFVLDVSGSMNQAATPGAKKTRLECAMEAIEYFASIHEKRKDPIELSLITFNDSARVVIDCDRSPTVARIQKALCEIQAKGGTEFAPAVGAAMDQAKEAFEAKRPVVMCFFTDGEDNDGYLLKAMRDFKARRWSSPLTDLLLQAERFTMHWVGIGDEADMDDLAEFSHFPVQSGECVQISGQQMGAVVGALYAIIYETLPDACEVEVLNDGRRMCVQVSPHVGDAKMVSKVAFFVKSNMPIGVALCVKDSTQRTLIAMGAGQIASAMHLDNSTAALAVKTLHPVTVDCTKANIQAEAFQEALEMLNYSFQCLRTVSKEVDTKATKKELEDLGAQILNIQRDPRSSSREQLSILQATASSNYRTLSGACTLVEDPDRMMSDSARSLSQAF